MITSDLTMFLQQLSDGLGKLPKRFYHTATERRPRLKPLIHKPYEYKWERCEPRYLGPTTYFKPRKLLPDYRGLLLSAVLSKVPP